MRAIALVSGAGEPLTAAYEGLVTVRCDLPSSRQVAHELGAAELLVKPISREELYAALDRLGRPVHRVLIADDDPEMVRLLQRMLHGRIPASACLEAYTGAEVLSLARSGKPDLLLLDLFMPEMNGPEVLEEMSADPDLAQTPVIIISGRAQDRISMRLPGPIQVCKTEGLELGEAVQALGALFGALAPGWH
jgi:CheY-like chemotaxis protein